MSEQAALRGDDAPGPPVPLLRVRDLTVGFPTPSGPGLAVENLDLDVFAGETLGIVGESGCGKSVTLRAVLGLVDTPGEILSGEVLWRDGSDLLRSNGRLAAIRGRELSMVFQDPLESLNPVFSIGDQLTEVLRVKGGLSRRVSRRTAVELLNRVGIPAADTRLRDYPHQLSGGMRQRVGIAIAIACGPTLLLADEPTTALDVTIQDQILTLLSDLQRETQLALVLVSHDLDVIAQVADRVAVMYAGHVVETGAADEVLLTPRHPYTAALIASAPRPQTALAGDRPQPIAGSLPALGENLPGCPFAPRCEFAREGCDGIDMRLDRAGPGAHASACPVVDLSREETRVDA